ncbi:maintenance of mitochondrial morphology protein 1 [Macrolepiota fuliginosa MF-IS2]|uniref:Maintenance of mitochondrial morphology protein 1 n=1 Tax=Macrolepiota fuliginosa MF-IS2 TaxID=1400762 RepID=A0A9P6C5L9_9AGAR|nr:maintenance of mitochondrial morphology protein 1 [Macrolepiota fuliginosa MF-IS2]
MSSNYLFTFQPNFTQGLVLGQLSILILIGLVLRYLFLDSTQYPFETSSYHPRVDNDVLARKRKLDVAREEEKVAVDQDHDAESAEWFNVLLKQVVDVYRLKLRDDLQGMEGDEVARRKIEEFANRVRPMGFLDDIKIHSVDLGVSAPRLFNARPKDGQMETEFDATYTDTISLSLSTSYLFNYPMASFARLPISLTISLSQFKSSISVTPPLPNSHPPVLTLSISPNFILDLTTTSLMGSRAKLANVPKLHELIQHQVRRVLAARATWKFPLPGLANIADVREKVKKEYEEDTASSR